MRQAVYMGYKGLAWAIFAAAVLQFFLAGLGVFEAADIGPHRIVGLLLVPISLIFLILAGIASATGSISRGRVGLAALLFGLMFLQAFLVIAFSESAPAIAALHPVNGLLVLLVSYTLARGRRLSQITESSAAEGGEAATSRVR
jgi:hypothetical membrane protein